MAIQWGGFNNHMRIGLEVWTDGYDTWTPSINIYVAAYVGNDNYPFGDFQRVELSGNVGGAWDYRNDMGNSQVMHIGTGVVSNQSQSYGGGPYYEFYGTLLGNYLGGNSTVGVGFTLPPRPKRIPSPPGTPGLSAQTPTSALLSWGDSGDHGGDAPGSWRLQVSANAEFTAVVHDTTGGNRSRTVNGLTPGTTYWARAASLNGIGWSGWSGTGAGATTTRPANAPGTPTFSAVTATSATLSWADSTDYGGTAPTSYRLQVSTDPGFGTTVHDTTQNDRSRSVTGLAPGTTYYARALTVNAAGSSAWSASRSAPTTGFGLAAPAVSGIAPDAATVTWGTPTGGTPTGYQVQRATDSGFTSGVVTVTSGTWATTQALSGLTPATNYYVRVRANTAAGYGAWSPGTYFQTLAGAKIRLNGAWVDGVARVRLDGAWVLAKVWKRVGGNWQV